MFHFIYFTLSLACKDSKTEDTERFDYPDIWGMNVLEDINPDPDIVEVNLEAYVTTKMIGDKEVPNVWTYNGQTPGPLLQAKKGDTVIVNFSNYIEHPTTIHWHGLRIPDDMDGTPAVQNPIQYEETFVYEYVVPDAGSYWYHPHMRSPEAVERGLQGAIVIHDPKDPVVAKERYFVLDDIFLNSFGLMGSFEMNRPQSVHGRFGNTLLANGQNIFVEPLTDSVRPATVERWRVVNTANARTMWIGVTGASWRIIAIDGTTLETPFTPEKATLPVGRRFDIEVLADPNEENVELQIYLPNDTGTFDDFTAFTGTIEGEEGDNNWLDWNTIPLPTASLPVEQEVTLEFDGYIDNDGLATWTINGVPFDEAEPIVVQGNTPSTIRVIDKAGAEHPYHLHGDFFQVLERSSGEMIPGQMDSILLEPDEEILIWTNFSNPGRWMSHCHILEHAERGLMHEFIVQE